MRSLLALKDLILAYIATSRADHAANMGLTGQATEGGAQPMSTLHPCLLTLFKGSTLNSFPDIRYQLVDKTLALNTVN